MLLSFTCLFKRVAEVQSDVSVQANPDVLFFYPNQKLSPLGKTHPEESASELPNSLLANTVDEPEFFKTFFF